MEAGGVVQGGQVGHRGEGGGAVAGPHDVVNQTGVQAVGQAVAKPSVLKIDCWGI